MYRRIDWSSALRDIKSDRRVRAEVREERLRRSVHLTGHQTIALSAWRGRSGRRYVVGVRMAEALADDLRFYPDALSEVVVLAVRRDPHHGLAEIAGITEGLSAAGAGNWLSSMRRAGVEEFHIHRLAQTAAERAAILVDLSDKTMGVA